MDTLQKRYRDLLLETARRGKADLSKALRNRFTKDAGPEPGADEIGRLDVVRWAYDVADKKTQTRFVEVFLDFLRALEAWDDRDIDADHATLASYALAFAEGLPDKGRFKAKLIKLGGGIAHDYAAEQFRRKVSKPLPGAEEDIAAQIDRLTFPYLNGQPEMLLRLWHEKTQANPSQIERNARVLLAMAGNGSEDLNADRLFCFFIQTRRFQDRNERMDNTIISIAGTLRRRGERPQALIDSLPGLLEREIAGMKSAATIRESQDKFMDFLDALVFLIPATELDKVKDALIHAIDKYVARFKTHTKQDTYLVSPGSKIGKLKEQVDQEEEDPILPGQKPDSSASPSALFH